MQREVGTSGWGCNSLLTAAALTCSPCPEKGLRALWGGSLAGPSLLWGGLSQRIGVFPKEGVASSGPNGGAYRTSDRPYSAAKWPFHPVTNRHHKASGCSSPASQPQPSSPSPPAQGPQSLSLLSSRTAAKDDNPVKASLQPLKRAPPPRAVCTPPLADRREGTPSAACEGAWPSHPPPPP